MVPLRRPVVAGIFYEGTAEELKAQIKSCFLHPFGPKKIPTVNQNGSRNMLGMICPHAGYIYSGPVAANAFFELANDGKPDTVVLLGPNHTGIGSGLSIMNEGLWRTPLGDVKIDSAIADDIIRETGLIDIDPSAHMQEHSIEVQLPFLQYLYGNNFFIVPICFLMQDLATAKEVGNALVDVLNDRNAIVIASSDFTHYETQTNVNRKDTAAIKAIEHLDENQLYSTLEEHNISACGYAPIATLITYSKGKGATNAQLLTHKTSGDITGDTSSVVGYAALTIKKSN